MVLEIAGLSPDEESVYALLVTFGRAGAADLAERDGMPVERMDRVLESLTAKGLASPTDGVPASTRRRRPMSPCCPGSSAVPRRWTSPSTRRPG